MRANVEPEDPAAYVRGLIEQHGLHLAGALHSEVLVDQGNGLVTVFAKVQFATTPTEARAPRLYRSATFAEHWLELENALQLLQGMVRPAAEGGVLAGHPSPNSSGKVRTEQSKYCTCAGADHLLSMLR